MQGSEPTLTTDGPSGVGSRPRRLICVCGLPGAGKTSVARTAAERTGAAVIRTDVVRKDRFPDPSYTDAETRVTYDELFDRARTALDRDGVAIVDGTFRREPLRERAREVATDAAAAFDLLKVECPEPIVKERLAAREGDESDADFDVHKLLATEFEPPEVSHRTIDNSGTPVETKRQVVDALRAVETVAGSNPGAIRNR